MHFSAVVALAVFASSASAAISGVHWKNDGARPARVNQKRQTGNLKYWGGPVIANVEVHPIWYGSGVADTTKIQAFYAGVTNSAYFDWLSEYNTPTQSIGRGSAVAAITATGKTTTSLTDADIQSFLTGLVKAGTITPTANTYFPIHFPAKYSISQGGANSCQAGGFCAYHGTIDVSGISSTKYLYYGVIPDQYTTGCSSGCGTDPTPFNNLCSVSSHELIEAVTDAAVGVATVVGSPLAWYDSANGEIGDICNASQGSVVGGDGVTYVVQKEWSNKNGACIATGSGTPKTTTTTKATSTTTGTTKPATSTTTTATTCAHDKCKTGAALKASCDPCVAKIIAADSFCGSSSWDSICVGEVKSVCGITC